jgi:5-hydroxyisourate hydrolase
MTISTHVLDTARGLPVRGVPVSLQRSVSADDWFEVAAGHTDADGRLRDWLPAGQPEPGEYRLVFATGGEFFPRVSIEFVVSLPGRHLHIPLLLSPFGYTTYRGS